ncbi:hypothetical protein HI914_06393 [Erysiphe necator]|uniref:Putative cytochrome P450 n=1 Tax=Uncinula necator TaxID=52586 RepID=A0A0B1NXV2_UNCNE|nr:hypothetical protein HI914_06393 [Erysiphe necator]KHJ31212.1 putative cytochrome P450 [Erysiphe necator]
MQNFIYTVIILAFLYRLINSIKRKKPKKPWQELLKKSTLEMRAIPNKRLVLMFGIENSFTTSSPHVHRRFLRSTIKKLESIAKSDWKKATEFVCQEVEERRYNAKVLGSLKLSSLVQCLTFRFIMYEFFSSVQPPRDTTIEKLTKKINSLWIKSKSFEIEKLEVLETEKKEILQLLSETMSEKVEEGNKNPFNIILPAYETLWRVVSHCFLETVFRASPEERLVYYRIARRFIHNPSLNTLNENGFEQINMNMIVKETLRLYPPTRRIYRLFDGMKDCVDVESLQRDHVIFGPNANKFQPRRWKNIEQEKLEQYLPFGYGKFKCPARNNVASMMIAILSSTLILKMGGNCTISKNLGKDPIPSERNSFDDIELTIINDENFKNLV